VWTIPGGVEHAREFLPPLHHPRPARAAAFSALNPGLLPTHQIPVLNVARVGHLWRAQWTALGGPLSCHKWPTLTLAIFGKSRSPGVLNMRVNSCRPSTIPDLRALPLSALSTIISTGDEPLARRSPSHTLSGVGYGVCGTRSGVHTTRHKHRECGVHSRPWREAPCARRRGQEVSLAHSQVKGAGYVVYGMGCTPSVG
jgi:hypothetical protein